ncbi:hypothetical protein GS854_25510 [Rhodococcus hoagii]|nr:hypothetical protein [Prescottella equi]
MTAAAVLVRDDRLVAYVVRDNGPEPATAFDAARLIRDLRRVLPDYMVPTALVELPALPRAPSTASWTSPRCRRPHPSIDSARPPRGALDDLVADAYRELLGLQGIGSDDDFFDLGGNSLLATQLAGRVAALTGPT